jgi:hypothetical protein
MIQLQIKIKLILMKMLMIKVYSLILYLVHATFLCSLHIIFMNIMSKIINE